MNDSDYNPNSTTAKLGGAKRKNGHKSNCKCHICENMINKAKRGGYIEYAEKEQLKKMGGSKKKNGHKPNCGCPICKNMRKKSRKGGDEPDEEKQIGDIKTNYGSSNETEASTNDYEKVDVDTNLIGGTRKKRGTKKSNGHKRGVKKTRRRHRKRTQMRH